jgi:rare lipoprotein A (peptidoglycan hydrolase)
MGSWHYPQDYYEYDEEGLASWYGPGFHGKPKPFGEKFNQYTLTAAHKTLPLPTVVKVTNLENGKSAIVLVDDRGPFVYDGRIIDLSLEAAKAIGSYQKGIARVRVQSLISESKALSDHLLKNGYRPGKDRLNRTWLEIYEQEIKGRFSSHPHQEAEVCTPKKAPQKEEPKSPASLDDFIKTLAGNAENKKRDEKNLSSYVLKVERTFVQKTNAEAMAKTFSKNLPVHVVQTKHPSGQSFWSLNVGPFTNEAACKTAQMRLKAMGEDCVMAAR